MTTLTKVDPAAAICHNGSDMRDIILFYVTRPFVESGVVEKADVMATRDTWLDRPQLCAINGRPC